MLTLASRLQILLLPPGNLIAAALFGLLASLRWWKMGIAVVAACIASLYVLSTPYIGQSLLHTLEASEAFEPPRGWQHAQAIVVLSANWQDNAPEYGGITVGEMTLARLRYTARLWRLTKLPVLVTGGPRTDGTGLVIADYMAKTLSDEFGVPVEFIEGKAFNTHESAIYSSRMLRRAGIESALVVTHAWHVPRTQLSFDQAGFSMVAAPMGFTNVPLFKLSAIFPSLKGITTSFYYFHEILGIAYYKYFL